MGLVLDLLQRSLRVETGRKKSWPPAMTQVGSEPVSGVMAVAAWRTAIAVWLVCILIGVLVVLVGVLLLSAVL